MVGQGEGQNSLISIIVLGKQPGIFLLNVAPRGTTLTDFIT